jgi:hypothetical protein
MLDVMVPAEDPAPPSRSTARTAVAPGARIGVMNLNAEVAATRLDEQMLRPPRAPSLDQLADRL